MNSKRQPFGCRFLYLCLVVIALSHLSVFNLLTKELKFVAYPAII